MVKASMVKASMVKACRLTYHPGAMTPVQQNYLDTIRRTQWLEPQRLLAYQGRLLEDICRHAYETVPFYRDRLAPMFRSGQFEPRAWHEVPVLHRKDVQDNAEAMRALSVPRFAARDADGITTGTTGIALKFTQSELAATASRCMFERMLEAHDIDRTAPLARIFAEDRGVAEYPEGLEQTGWNLACPEARRSRLSVLTPIAQQAEWLMRRRPTYLGTYQSSALALAIHFRTVGLKLPLKGLFTVGETVTPLTRQEVRDVFGCEIIDSYATTEVGNIAIQCPAGRHHVCAEANLLELLDDSGEDALPGARGRVVVTSFYNFAMPFIRYAINDYAVAEDGPCSCGRTLPCLRHILGRQRNVFTFADGSQVSPYKWQVPITEYLQAKQIQLVQTALDHIELRFVPKRGQDHPDPAVIEKIGREFIHPDVMLRAIPVEDIPRHPSGKLEDCLSLVSAPARR